MDSIKVTFMGAITLEEAQSCYYETIRQVGMGGLSLTNRQDPVRYEIDGILDNLDHAVSKLRKAFPVEDNFLVFPAPAVRRIGAVPFQPSEIYVIKSLPPSTR
ncbi:MAG: hypothetical protein H6867_10265 [Rhodospirillales bacterium]|nr:hypothetical protein [Rhodospirillales bacterium]MCB9995832.1 hypothetical protein [Rhodospirillales bacterium]